MYKAVLLNPYDVSVGNQVSSLSVVPTSDASWMKGKDGVEVIMPKMDDYPTMKEQLPAQVVEEDVKILEETTETSETVTKGSIVLTIFTTIIIAGSLGLVWGLVGVLQNLAIMAFINVNYPGNAQGFIGQVDNLANLDILPDYFIKPWLDFFQKFEDSESPKRMKRKLN